MKYVYMLLIVICAACALSCVAQAKDKQARERALYSAKQAVKEAKREADHASCLAEIRQGFYNSSTCYVEHLGKRI